MLNLHPIEWFADLDPEIAVMLLSMIPITELRAAIPIGIEAYGLHPASAWIFGVIGNIIPTIFILLLIPIVHDWILKKKFFGGVLVSALKRAEKRFSGRYAKYGAIALVVFVGIPLPLTGAWTGSLAAFLFNIPFRKSFPLIAAGVCLAATIVTGLTLFAGGALRAFF